MEYVCIEKDISFYEKKVRFKIISSSSGTSVDDFFNDVEILADEKLKTEAIKHIKLIADTGIALARTSSEYQLSSYIDSRYHYKSRKSTYSWPTTLSPTILSPIELPLFINFSEIYDIDKLTNPLQDFSTLNTLKYHPHNYDIDEMPTIFLSLPGRKAMSHPLPHRIATLSHDAKQLCDESIEIEDGNKLFFDRHCSFPVRKLKALVGIGKKVNELSTVRSVNNADKIIINDKIIKDIIDNSIETGIHNTSSTKNGCFLALKINYGAHEIERCAELSIYDMDFLIRNGLLYFNSETISDMPSFLAEMYNIIKDILIDSGVSEEDFIKYRKSISFEGTIFSTILGCSGIDGEHSSKEILSKNRQHTCFNRPSLCFSFSNNVLVDALTKKIPIVGVSKLYSKLGDTVMDYETYKRIMATLQGTGDQDIKKMILETLPTYNVEKSIFYLTLIVKNFLITNKWLCNTSVKSLMSFCMGEFAKSIGRTCLHEYVFVQSSVFDIANGLGSMYDVNVPAQLLIDEGFNDIASVANVDLAESCTNKFADTEKFRQKYAAFHSGLITITLNKDKIHFNLTDNENTSGNVIIVIK